MNGRAFLPKNEPKLALRQIDGGFDARKAKSCASDLLDLSKVVKVIGRNVQSPILYECRMNRGQEIGC